MTELEKAQARITALESENSALQGDNDKLKGQVANFEEADKQRSKDAIKNKVAALVTTGFLLPAQQAEVAAFCEKLDASQILEFGEGDDKKTTNMVDSYLAQFNKKVVDFNEHSEDDGQGDQEITAESIAAKAVIYQEERAAKGQTVSIQQAVAFVTASKE